MNFPAMFEFAEDDVRSNKRGFLSARQREVITNMAQGIRRSAWSSLKVGPFSLFLGLCIIGACFFQMKVRAPSYFIARA